MPKASKAKKLVSVLTTSALVTGASKEAYMTKIIREFALDRVLCIYYQVKFRNNKGATIQALINSGGEINAITLTHTKKLGLWTQRNDVGPQKIDRSSLDTFGIVIAGFQILNKQGRVRFFQEIFLLANITMEVILGMLFFTFINADI